MSREYWIAAIYAAAFVVILLGLWIVSWRVAQRDNKSFRGFVPLAAVLMVVLTLTGLAVADNYMIHETESSAEH